MATRNAASGLDHPTVVPENFEPEDSEDVDEMRESRASDDDRAA